MNQRNIQAGDSSSGLVLIDKPKGITSFDVIRILRKKIGVKKMGHAGTLDPQATGLLVVAYGKNTKLLKDFLGLPKKYIAHIQLGIKTTTGDLDGKIIEQKNVPSISKSNVEKILQSMVGKLELPVPLFSAIKKQGKPLYAYARAKQAVEVPIKPMRVYEAVLEKIEKNILTINFKVGSGTYIRSLAEEIGTRLGTVATLSNLRRTQVGDFIVEDASPLA
jgi:tRNA pseudouridine55 synthase